MRCRGYANGRHTRAYGQAMAFTQQARGQDYFVARVHPTDPDSQGSSVCLTLTNMVRAKIITSSPKAAGWHQPQRPLDLLPSHAPTLRHLNPSVSMPLGEPWAHPSHPPLKETGCQWCPSHPDLTACWLPALSPPAWQPQTFPFLQGSCLLEHIWC